MIKPHLYVFLSLFALGSACFADCGYNQVHISGATAFEAKTSCESLKQVLGLFKKIEVEIDPEIKLSFEKQAAITAASGEVIPVHGYFDDETFEMHITTFESPRNEELTPWGLKWDRTQGVSYVLHEMTHLVVASELQRKNLKLKRVWHEFAAYAVQLELMDPELLQKILEAYPKTEAFDSPEIVNQDFYEMDPDLFAVKAYRSMKSWGGTSFLKKLIHGEIPVALRIEFMELTYSPKCILEAVSKKMDIPLKPEIELPKLFPHSTTSMEQLKYGARFNYPEGYEITFYTNFYAMETNELYVNNKKPLVGKNGRTPDDVLAHELTHYMQVKYKNYSKEEGSSDTAEEFAVQVQTWFRDSFTGPEPKGHPCPETEKKGLQFSSVWEF